MKAVVWVALAIAGGLISIVLTVLLQDGIATALSRVLFLPLGGGGRNVSGTWYTYYTVVPDKASSATAGKPSQAIETIQLRALGSRVVGHNAAHSRDYVIQAVLKDGQFLTGTWRDYSKDQYHWGGFQLCWSASGSRMAGKFVGKDSHNHINHGLWVWSRDRAELLAAAQAMVGDGAYGGAAEQLLADVRRLLAVPDQPGAERGSPARG